MSSFFDNQETPVKGGGTTNESNLKELKIRFKDTKDIITVNKNCVSKMYKDAMPRLLIVVDEMAELTLSTGVKTEEGKREDALRQEIIANLQSITQLGRSAGIHCILCTQRASTDVIPGVIKNNPLDIDTEVVVK